MEKDTLSLEGYQRFRALALSTVDQIMAEEAADDVLEELRRLRTSLGNSLEKIERLERQRNVMR